MPKTSGGDRRSENFKIPPTRKFENGTGANQYQEKVAEIPPAGKFSEESDDEEEPPAKPKLEVAKDMGFNKNQVADK